MNHNKFITIEGVDGAGKSSHVDDIANLFKAAGYEVVCTREPGGTPLGEELRDMLLHKPWTPAPETEAMLMFSSRKELLAKVIEPALARGAVVLCDRFTDSTLAYQGGGRGVDMDFLNQMKQATHPHLQPGLTLLFDLPPNVSMERLSRATKKPDNFEALGLSFFESVRKVYLNLAKEEDRFKIMDSAAPLENVKKQVLDTVSRHIQALTVSKSCRLKP